MKMKHIRFYHPRELVFGDGSLGGFFDRFIELPYRKPFIVADPHICGLMEDTLDKLGEAGMRYEVFSGISGEPTLEFFRKMKGRLEKGTFDSVLGIGGGSVLDTAKLLAALSYTGMEPENAFGIGKIGKRELFLGCIPTTAGTGSEVSPNAVLLDETEHLKKGIVSPYLVPDAACIDPVLTHSVPPAVTAATGIDALTHCLEAFSNRFAHPLTDLYALRGVELIFGSLEDTCGVSPSPESRADVALGSLYGGMCLGPVNTAAVHALSYPLGGEYHIPHGVSNAMLLPHVMRKSLPEAAATYAKVARALGVATEPDETTQALQAIDAIDSLCRRVGIPQSLEAFHVSPEAVPSLARSAYKVKRLLDNNPRELSLDDIVLIYEKLF